MKTYVIVAAILAVVGLLPAIYLAGYHQGKTSTVATYKQAALEHRDKENKLLLQLEKAKKERKIVHIERIKVVNQAADACLDSPVPESISGLLHDASTAKTQSVTDKGL
jgi:hypothetical protein